MRQPHGPYYLGGLCAGGVIAFEMARLLNRANEDVELVALLDAVEPTTPQKRFFVARRRLARLVRRWRRDASNGERGERAAAPVTTKPRPGSSEPKVVRIWHSARETTFSAGRMLRYELMSRASALSVSLRFRLLREVLGRGWTWPAEVRPLTVREIYTCIRDSYAPSAAQIKLALLVKATATGEGDEGVRDQFDDPLLGWGRLVEGNLQAVDTRGGHSSMLQEPWVEEVVELLAKSLAPPASQPAPQSEQPARAKDVVARDDALFVQVAQPSKHTQKSPPIAS
jgi:hypothetical protein